MINMPVCYLCGKQLIFHSRGDNRACEILECPNCGKIEGIAGTAGLAANFSTIVDYIQLKVT